MNVLTPEMKADLQRKKEIEEIHEKLKMRNPSVFRTTPLKKGYMILPEDFTGKDLKRAKKLMRRKDKKLLKKK